MNNKQSNYQDLTLDFIGDQEILVITPKNTTQTGVQQINKGSAIISKKVTSVPQSPKENLDSSVYLVVIESNPNSDRPCPFAVKLNEAFNKILSPQSSQPKTLISKDELLKNFHISGILNIEKLRDTISKKGNLLELGTFIELFPETNNEFLQWVNE